MLKLGWQEFKVEQADLAVLATPIPRLDTRGVQPWLGATQPSSAATAAGSSRITLGELRLMKEMVVQGGRRP